MDFPVYELKLICLRAGLCVCKHLGIVRGGNKPRGASAVLREARWDFRRAPSGAGACPDHPGSPREGLEPHPSSFLRLQTCSSEKREGEEEGEEGSPVLSDEVIPEIRCVYQPER